MTCHDCGAWLGDDGHFVHDLGCNRALEGWCRCDGTWVCSACCKDSDCRIPPGELARALADANHQPRCARCKGTGWLCDTHRRGACRECEGYDGSLSGCPDCTPPGACGGTGRTHRTEGAA